MIVGLPILIIAVIFRIFPPRGINSLYGYRTASAKRNEEAWHFANRYSANGLIIISAATVLLQSLDIRIVARGSAEMIAAVFMAVGIIAVIASTEWRLHRRLHLKP